MTDIKKINIYMGIVGQAYVDKETAKKKMEAAEKNIWDVKYIIWLINHSYEDELFLLDDNVNYPLSINPSYREIAETTLANAQAAQQLANEVKTRIENALGVYTENDLQYKELNKLLIKLRENDYDGDWKNGGNVKLAEANVKRINAFISELTDIENTAQQLLAENIAYYEECVTLYNNAKEVFESYIPDIEEDQASKSDRLEAWLLERLGKVATGLEVAQNTTDAINQTSNETNASANKIINGNDNPETMYTISFNLNGGTSDITEIKGTMNQIIHMPDAPTREGYTFKGWGNGNILLNHGDEYEIVGDAGFTAVWVEESDEPQPGDNNDYYLGLATEEQIQDQSYINGLDYNTSGVKPTELTLSAGYNLIIYPSEWGNVIITDESNYEVPPYSAEDLHIINPENKIVIAEEMNTNDTHVNLSWN